MSNGYGPPREEPEEIPARTEFGESGGGFTIKREWVLWAVIAVLSLSLVIMGISLSQNATREPVQPEKVPTLEVDPYGCEYVLTPKRDAAYLRCPVPDNFPIPNWPDKDAPLNK